MKRKTKKQLKAQAERSAGIITEIETHPRMAFKKSCVVTAADLHISPQQKTERMKIMKARTKKQKTTVKKVRGIKGKNGLGVCATWLKLFQTKAIKTKAACSKAIKKNFPGRTSRIFDYPNVVISRANKGILDGKNHKFKKYTS